MLILGFLLVIAVLAVVLLPRRMRPGRPIRVSQAGRALEARRAQAILDRAVGELYAGEDPRSVIVRAYQRMARLVSGRLPDASALTPRELSALAQQRFGWPKGPTDELTALFEEAWYSQHPLGEQQKERALRCLQELSIGAEGGGSAGRGGKAPAHP